MLHAYETGISSGHLGLGSCAPLPSFCTLHIGNVFPSLVINPSINIRHSNSKRRNLFFLGCRDLTVFFVFAKNWIPDSHEKFSSTDILHCLVNPASWSNVHDLVFWPQKRVSNDFSQSILFSQVILQQLACPVFVKTDFTLYSL